MQQSKPIWKYIIVSLLMMVTFILFVVGLFLNYDGLNILLHANQYEYGELRVDSLFAGPAGSGAGGELTSYAVGVVDDVNTALMIGTTGTDYVDSISHQFIVLNATVLIPVWFREDGALTLKRNSDNEQFPLMSILSQVLFYLLCFNGPFIGLWLIQRRLKKKYNINEK